MAHGHGDKTWGRRPGSARARAKAATRRRVTAGSATLTSAGRQELSCALNVSPLRCGPVASAAAATVWRSELRAATTDSASHFLCRSSTHVIPTRLALRYLCSPPINTGPNRTLTLAPVRMKLWLCNTLEGDIIRKLPPFPLPSSLPSFMPLQFQFSFFFIILFYYYYYYSKPKHSRNTYIINILQSLCIASMCHNKPFKQLQ